MIVLFTITLSSMTQGQVSHIERDARQLTILGSIEGIKTEHSSGILHKHSVDPDVHALPQSNRFHAVAFFYAFPCDETQENISIQGSQLNMLFQFCQSAEQNGADRFILMTSQRVFGDARGDQQ